MAKSLVILFFVFIFPWAARADASDTLDKRIEAKTLDKNSTPSGSIKNSSSVLQSNGQSDPVEPRLKRKSAKHNKRK